MQLDGARIAITGGAGGIGRELTARLAAAGAKVLVVDRNPDADAIADLAAEESLSALCAALAQDTPDILINLAGMMYFGPAAEQAPAHLAATLRVNLEAPMRLAQAVLPAMKRRRRGQIVNVGSVFGLIPFPHFAAYSATKAGLKGFSDALRRETMGTGVIVTHIAPRAVKTGLNSGVIEELHRRTKTMRDAPDVVAARMAEAIAMDRQNIVIGFPESFFARLNAIAPILLDKALIRNRDIAEALIEETSREKERFNAKAA